MNVNEIISPNVTRIVKFDCRDLYNTLNFFGGQNIVTDLRVHNGKIFVMDTDIIDTAEDAVRNLFDEHQKSGDLYPVSVTGLKTDGDVGSHRFCTWNKTLANLIDSFIKEVNILERLDYGYVYEGISKYFRFMCYETGGEHYPHYDSDFHVAEKIVTKYSLVMYFTDNESGELAFCHDNREDKLVDHRTDWERQATEEEIYLKILPKRGRIVFFPHDLCHTVLPFTDKGDRIIARGDVIFKKV